MSSLNTPEGRPERGQSPLGSGEGQSGPGSTGPRASRRINFRGLGRRAPGGQEQGAPGPRPASPAGGAEYHGVPGRPPGAPGEPGRDAGVPREPSAAAGRAGVPGSDQPRSTDQGAGRAAGTERGAGPRTDAGWNRRPRTERGAGPGSEAGAGSGSETGTGPGSEAGAGPRSDVNAGSDTGTDRGAGSGSDAGHERGSEAAGGAGGGRGNGGGRRAASGGDDSSGARSVFAAAERRIRRIPDPGSADVVTGANPALPLSDRHAELLKDSVDLLGNMIKDRAESYRRNPTNQLVSGATSLASAGLVLATAVDPLWGFSAIPLTLENVVTAPPLLRRSKLHDVFPYRVAVQVASANAKTLGMELAELINRGLADLAHVYGHTPSVAGALITAGGFTVWGGAKVREGMRGRRQKKLHRGLVATYKTDKVNRDRLPLDVGTASIPGRLQLDLREAEEAMTGSAAYLALQHHEAAVLGGAQGLPAPVVYALKQELAQTHGLRIRQLKGELDARDLSRRPTYDGLPANVFSRRERQVAQKHLVLAPPRRTRTQGHGHRA